MKQSFTKSIIKWHDNIDRNLPWVGVKDPYKIWLSEIILQQTRVNQGLAYYNRFTEKFPTITLLAQASEDKILKLWQGLGYYSRARNLHATAKYIHFELDDIFPNNFNDLKKLKGIGAYTAAAIASFAFNEPRAVVDGNVYRVLSRYFGIKTPTDTNEGKKQFTMLANELISQSQPGNYNQAIMDFGALQCKPVSPECKSCCLKNKCIAFKNDWVGTLPLKSKKIKIRKRYFNYFIMREGENLMLHKRTNKDIWKGLFDFPIIECERPITQNELLMTEEYKALFGNSKILAINNMGKYQQQLTHQKIYANFYEVKIKSLSGMERSNFIQTKFKKLDIFAFPKIIDLFLKDKAVYSTIR